MATPQRFSPMRAMGIPARPHAAYFEEDAFAAPTFNPDRGYSSAPVMATQFDPFEAQAADLEAQRDLSTLEAQQDIMGGQTDWMSPEGRRKSLEYMMRGAISPQQAYAIDRLGSEPAPNKYSPVPAEVVKATSALESIDPTDPEAWNQMNAALQAIDADPVLGQTDVRAHPYLRETLQDLKRNIFASRGGSQDDRDPRIWYGSRGGNPADVDSGKFLDPKTGKLDRALMAYELAKSKARAEAVLSPTERKILDAAVEDLQGIRVDTSEGGKKLAFRMKYGRDPETEEDWSIAHQLASGAADAQREKLRALIEDLGATKTIPPIYKRLAGMEPEKSSIVTSSMITSPDEAGKIRQESLSGMSGQSTEGAAQMPQMPRGGSSGAVQALWNLSNPEAEIKRQGILQGVFKEGQTPEETLRNLRGRKLTNASPGLLQSVERGVVVQEVPPRGSQASTSLPLVHSPSELKALGLPPGAQFRTPDGRTGTVK